MKQSLRKIVALFMAALVLASTVSWTIEKHYCLGSLIDIAFFHEAESCGMQPVPDDNPARATLDRDSCCNDEVISIQGLDGLTFPDRDQVVVLPFLFVAPDPIQVHFLEPVGQLSSPFEKYRPPLLARNVHVLNEVFLI
ncbi:MAG TPA: hypothetical protein VKZ93_05995 [Arenibacter sp.]|nr:hypothetical protein [Arenibacter sp.]